LSSVLNLVKNIHTGNASAVDVGIYSIPEPDSWFFPLKIIVVIYFLKNLFPLYEMR